MNKKLHVVLDLDETLIHGDVLNMYADDQTFKSKFDVSILLRPHVVTFLKKKLRVLWVRKPIQCSNKRMD